MTITEFLLARIAEDEERDYELHYQYDCAVFTFYDEGGLPCDCGYPARVRRECEAKRRIVERAQFIDTLRDDSGSLAMADLEYDEHILPLLASVYADHPDYDAAWA